MSRTDPRDPEPSEWPVLVTGAGGFVGGHIARHLARSGHHVRAIARRIPSTLPDDPPIDWVLGDLRDNAILRMATEGIRGVIHTAAWVSLGRDPGGLSRAINVEATRNLLDEARLAGVERFVYTSTLHTLAAGTPESPADEETPWNLHTVDSPYSRTKREAESIVREASRDSFSTVVLCPGMVLGPRDTKPTSTRLVQTMASSPITAVPSGGIPIVDSTVIASAHRRALHLGRAGERYAIVGPYYDYAGLARVVGEVSGWPLAVIVMPDILRAPLTAFATLFERMAPSSEISATTVAGGYLHLHISGKKADECFDLIHPPGVETIRSALNQEARSRNASTL